MHPVLFPANTTVFTTNGLGALSDALSCTVTEERNGAFELTMKYPANGIHFNEIKEGMLLRAKPNDTDGQQLFRIYSISKAFNNQVEIEAEHVSYELNNFPVTPVLAVELDQNADDPYSPVGFTGTPNQVWTHFAEGDIDPGTKYSPIIPVNGEFTFDSDFNTQYEIKIDEVKSLRELLGGDQGSMLHRWQGEFQFNNYNIYYMKSRGRDTGVTIKFGKNLTDLTQDISTESMYTHIVPYAVKTLYVEREDPQTHETTYDTFQFTVFADDPSGQETQPDQGTWSGGVITIKQGADTIESLYGFKRVKFLDLTSQFGEDSDFEPADVRRKCESYISENPEIKRPKITLTVSFEPKSTIGKSDVIDKLEKISLCDTVRVVHPIYGIDEKLKVNKTVYNVLVEKYKKVEIGDAKSNFADTIRDRY